jgi:hypothetical protein
MDRERCPVGRRDEGSSVIPNLGRKYGSSAEIWGRGGEGEGERRRGEEVNRKRRGAVG